MHLCVFGFALLGHAAKTMMIAGSAISEEVDLILSEMQQFRSALQKPPKVLLRFIHSNEPTLEDGALSRVPAVSSLKIGTHRQPTLFTPMQIASVKSTFCIVSICFKHHRV
jgi:hypothetical protein